MIVDPDFLDHWRVSMLRSALGDDPLAPLYVIRLWAHCQVRKAVRFEKIPPAGLAAICHAGAHRPDVFEQAMLDCRFIERDGDGIYVPDWEDHNRALIAAWENGRTGGRPKKQPPPKPPTQQGQGQAPCDFERWWQAYPKRRRTAKPKCEAKWASLRSLGKLPPIDAMLSTLAAQAASHDWTKDGGDYIPMPLTYLNQGRYTDDPPPAGGGHPANTSKQAGVELQNAAAVARFASTDHDDPPMKTVGGNK